MAVLGRARFMDGPLLDMKIICVLIRYTINTMYTAICIKHHSNTKHYCGGKVGEDTEPCLSSVCTTLCSLLLPPTISNADLLTGDA